MTNVLSQMGLDIAIAGDNASLNVDIKDATYTCDKVRQLELSIDNGLVAEEDHVIETEFTLVLKPSDTVAYDCNPSAQAPAADPAAPAAPAADGVALIDEIAPQVKEFGFTADPYFEKVGRIPDLLVADLSSEDTLFEF